MRGLPYRLGRILAPVTPLSRKTSTPGCAVLRRRLTMIGYTCAITVAGIVACWSVSMVISALEMITLDQLFPDMLSQGALGNTLASLALRLAGCLGLMGGGYVTAWLASKVQRSGLKHAVVVGCIYGALGILSDNGYSMSWSLMYVVFLIAVMAASLGAWMCETQLRHRRTLEVAMKRAPRPQSLPFKASIPTWKTGTFNNLQDLGPTRQSRSKLASN